MTRYAVMAVLLLAGAACAQGAPPGPPPGNSACKPQPKLDQTPLFDQLDTGHTGRVTKEQWVAAFGQTGTLFQDMDSKHQGYLTLDELQASNPPHWIDTNHDGKLDLAEEKAALAQIYAPGAKPAPHTGC